MDALKIGKGIAWGLNPTRIFYDNQKIKIMIRYFIVFYTSLNQDGQVNSGCTTFCSNGFISRRDCEKRLIKADPKVTKVVISGFQEVSSIDAVKWESDAE
jgi:hypothetical protein